MPAERLSMRKIREVLRLDSLGVSRRQIGRCVGVNHGTVSDYLGRAKVTGLSWPLPEDFDDGELEKRLFVPREENRKGRPPPDLPRVHLELRKPYVTLALLWQEYKEVKPEGYQFSQFCDLYRRWGGHSPDLDAPGPQGNHGQKATRFPYVKIATLLPVKVYVVLKRRIGYNSV